MVLIMLSAYYWSQISAITMDYVAYIGLALRKQESEIIILYQSLVTQVRCSIFRSFIPHRTSSPKFNLNNLIILPKITSFSSSTPIVFYASAKSSTGVSLNDIFYFGPKLQTDINDLLLTCRLDK